MHAPKADVRLTVGRSGFPFTILTSLVIVVGLFAPFAIGKAELIVRDGAPPIDPARYTSLANQPRFDGVVSLVSYILGDDGTKISAPKAFCTGTLISPDIVLTAAHCVDAVDLIVAKNGGIATIAGKRYLFGGLLGPDISSAGQAFVIKNYVVHPTWDPKTRSGEDVALLRIADALKSAGIDQYIRNGRSEPIQFIPLYDGSEETAQPFPNIGTSLGYGNTGDGLAGESSASAGLKRGSFVLVTNKLDNGELAAKFETRQRQAALKLPSNFLEGQLGRGDSGGPLFQPIGLGGAMVQTGVARSVLNISGTAILDLIIAAARGLPNPAPDNRYGADAFWTRVSPLVDWIKTESASLGGHAPAVQ